MANAKTLEELQHQHDSTIEQNRLRPVVDVPTKNQKKADVIMEITDGFKHIPEVGPDGLVRKIHRLGPGQRFRPTESEVATRRTLSNPNIPAFGLRGKARELTASEMKTVNAGSRPTVAVLDDIGLRTLRFQADALKRAIDARLEVSDFDDITPERGGWYKVNHVDEAIRRREEKRLVDLNAEV